MSTDEPSPKRAKEAAAEEVTLWSYWRSSTSYRVRIVLHLKAVAFATQPVNLLASAQLAPAFEALNPMRAVPVLRIDGLTLVQSSAIIEYLEETRPDHPLLPAAPAARAVVRAVAAIVSHDVHPVCNLRVAKRVAALVDANAATAGTGKAAAREWSAGFVADGFAAIEALIAPVAGAHAVGDAVTLADVYLVTQHYNACRVGVDMAPYPTIARVVAAAAALPAFVAAHPNQQPDFDPAAGP